MRAIHFLVGIIAFASAGAADRDELVQDRDTVAIVQQRIDKELTVIRDVIVSGTATTRNVFEDD